MIEEPEWLTKDMVLAFHREQLARFGGGAGLRDEGLLESALGRPVNTFHYEPESTLAQLAAVYCARIVQNHPFVDGNKRAGFLTVPTFLKLNGLRFRPPREEAVLMILGLAAGDVDEKALAPWIEANSKPID